MHELCFLQDDGVKAEGEEFDATHISAHISCGEVQVCKRSKGTSSCAQGHKCLQLRISHFHHLSSGDRKTVMLVLLGFGIFDFVCMRSV